MAYLLIPLDEAIVFHRHRHAAIDVGDEDRVFASLPRAVRRGGRRGDRARSLAPHRQPGRDRARPAPRPTPAPPSPAMTTTRCASTSRSSTTATPTTRARASWPASTAPWSRRSSSCAAVSTAFLRSVQEPGLADTAGLSPEFSADQELRLWTTWTSPSASASPSSCSASASPSCRCAAAFAMTSSPVPRSGGPVLPAQTDGVDPQRAADEECSRGRPDRPSTRRRWPRRRCREGR